MKVGFDASVLIAGLYSSHPHHRRAILWLDAVMDRSIDGIVSCHAIAETYSVLTKLPIRPRLDPAIARSVVSRLIDGPFEALEHGEAVYRAAVDRCVETDSVSGAIYDAVHLLVAESAPVDAFVTFNERHFRRLRPEVPLVVPPDPPSVSIPE